MQRTPAPDMRPDMRADMLPASHGLPEPHTISNTPSSLDARFAIPIAKIALGSDFSINEMELFFALAPAHVRRNSSALLSKDMSLCRDLARTIERERERATVMVQQALQPIESGAKPLICHEPTVRPPASPATASATVKPKQKGFTHAVVLPDVQDSSPAASCDILPHACISEHSQKRVKFADQFATWLAYPITERATPSPTRLSPPYVAVVHDPPHDPLKSDVSEHSMDVRLKVNDAACVLASMHDSEPVIFQLDE